MPLPPARPRSYFPLLFCLLAGLLGLAARPARAQATLSGTVRDSLTRQPLPFASVFLAGTTRGTTADAQGRYVLAGVAPGRYELAATYVGYRLRQRPLVLAAGARQADLDLPPTAQALGEVVVRPDPHREDNYRRFLELFLGTSTAARQCRVRNPDAVQVAYDGERRTLTASAAQPLEVDNPALGYRLTFYDLDFRAEFGDEGVEATSLSHLAFRELPGGAGRQRRWAAGRARAYAGSYLHFLRSVYAGTVAAEGFEVQRLRRVPNRRRAAADSLRQAIQAGGQLGQAAVPDSVWRLLRQPRAFSYLYAPLLPPAGYRQAADGRVWLRFPDLLAVTYVRGRPDANYHQPGLTLTPGRELASVLHLQAPTGAEVEAGGTLADPLALLAEGYWSFQKMGDLLPLDYK